MPDVLVATDDKIREEIELSEINPDVLENIPAKKWYYITNSGDSLFFDYEEVFMKVKKDSKLTIDHFDIDNVDPFDVGSLFESSVSLSMSSPVYCASMP